MSSSAYQEHYNTVVLEEAAVEASIRGKYPFQNSEWGALIDSNVGNPSGELLRATFFTGGSLFMDLVQYRASLTAKAADIDHGRILTDVEVASNYEGIRLFFELDYRTSTVVLPTWEEAMLHLRVLYRTVTECFPDEEAPTMHIATCSRKRKQKRSKDGIDLAWGIHVVFPDIITTTPTMRLIAQLLDSRISNIFPAWNAIVDPAPYRKESATLRPCFSYKMIECPICSMGAAATSTKRKRDHKKKPPEDLTFRLRMSETCTCYGGRKVEPSTYRYVGSLQQADGPVVELMQGSLAVLHQMSITPTTMGQFTQGFVRPVDMGDKDDRIPQSDIVFPSEKRQITGFNKRKNSEDVNMHTHVEGYHALIGTLKNIHSEYAHVAIHKVSMNRAQQTFLVTVKGNGSRYCMYKTCAHNSNRVYFVINMKAGRVQMYCFDRDCRRDFAASPIVRTVSTVDRHNITRAFGLKPSSERPTITPPQSSSPVVVVSPPNPVTKRELFERKRQAYLSTLAQ